MVGKLGYIPGACALIDGVAIFGYLLVIYSIVYVPNQVVFFLSVSGQSHMQCAPSKLSSNSGFKFLFYIQIYRKYTDSYQLYSLKLCSSSKCHSGVGHSGDPPDGVFYRSPIFLMYNKFCIFP